MLTVIRSQLRHRLARTLALFLGLLVATTSFAVLTGTTETSRLVVTGEVEENFRPAYDILVRPAGSTTAMEQSEALVRESYLSGQFGGLTWEEYEAVTAIPGVAVAAPVAFLGYVMENVSIPVDVTEFLSDADRQVLRLDVSRVVDSGLSVVPGEFTRYLYVTSQALEPLDQEMGYAVGARELVDGEEVVVCPMGEEIRNVEGSFDPALRTGLTCGSRSGEGFSFHDTGTVLEWTGTSATVYIPGSFPFLIAAVDPQAEAALVGLDGSVTDGRYFEASEGATVTEREGREELAAVGRVVPADRSLPVLLSSRPFAAGVDRVQISDLGEAGVAAVLASSTEAELLSGLPGQQAVSIGQLDLSTEDAFAALGADRFGYGPDTSAAWNFWIASAPSLTVTGDRSLAIQPVPGDSDWWTFTGGMRPFYAAAESRDVAFREVTAVAGNNTAVVDAAAATGEERIFPIPSINVIGRFDPAEVQTGAQLAAVPLSLYAPSRLVGGDDAARAALGDGPLLPNGSMVGYAQEPPMMLTTIQALREANLARAYPALEGTGAVDSPIGSIRVRVEGAVDLSDLSRERVRLIAERIATETGLEVDIVTGSSPAPVAIAMPAGDFGRPALDLEESWVQKGVALDLIDAVDRKSVTLFGLILLVCALFAVNAVSAAVRERRRELAVLACVGWGRWHLFRSVLVEVGLIGLAAGLAGAALAWPITRLAGLELQWWRPLVAIPAAVLLALLAAVVPALRASRSHPGGAVRPMVVGQGGRRSPRSLFGLSMANLARRPGRTILAGISLALGVAATCILLAVNSAFAGSATGTLLGDAVTLNVRGVDVIAVGAVVLLGAVATADALYIGVRERAGELALLRGVGWGEVALGRLVVWEGLAIGVVAALVGAGAGLLAISRFVGEVTPVLVAVAGIAAAVGVLVTVVALAVPLTALARVPAAALLAEEA